MCGCTCHTPLEPFCIMCRICAPLAVGRRERWIMTWRRFKWWAWGRGAFRRYWKRVIAE